VGQSDRFWPEVFKEFLDPKNASLKQHAIPKTVQVSAVIASLPLGLCRFDLNALDENLRRLRCIEGKAWYDRKRGRRGLRGPANSSVSPMDLPPHPGKRGKAKYWYADAGLLAVEFDENGKAIGGAHFYSWNFSPRQNPFRRFLRWLGL
jgi:hypothetical protein